MKHPLADIGAFLEIPRKKSDRQYLMAAARALRVRKPTYVTVAKAILQSRGRHIAYIGSQQALRIVRSWKL